MRAASSPSAVAVARADGSSVSRKRRPRTGQSAAVEQAAPDVDRVVARRRRPPTAAFTPVRGLARSAARGAPRRSARARSVEQHGVGERLVDGARSACSAREALAVARQRAAACRRRARQARRPSTSSITTVWRASSSRTRAELHRAAAEREDAARGALEQLGDAGPPRPRGTRARRARRSSPRSSVPRRSLELAVGVDACTPSARAAARAPVVLPAPMKPMKTSAGRRSHAVCVSGSIRSAPRRRGRPRGRRRCGRRRTCRGRRRRARSPASPPPRRPRRARRRSRCARAAPAAGSFVAMSTERSGLVSVGIGFIATRTTSGSPVVMPPSRPPERFVSR